MPRWVKALFAAELALAVLHLLLPPVPLWAERGGATRYMWDLDAEANFPTWFASAQLAVLGALLVVLAVAWRARSRNQAIGFAAAAVFVALLSLDELISIHEKLGRGLEEELGGRGSTPFDETGPWVAVAVPLFLLAIGAGFYLLRGVFAGHRRAALLCGGGLAVFFVSFAGLELVANALDTGDEHTVLFEEVGEMAGVTLVLWGVFDLMRSHGIRLTAAEPAATGDREHAA